MVDYRFEDGKDAWLQREGRIGFAAVIQAIEAGGLLGILPNPRYPGQQIAAVVVDDHVYHVPFRPQANGTVWELITLYPSRRATRAWRTRRPS